MDNFLRKFEEVLEIDENSVSMETKFEEIPWDSLAALSTVVMLQEEYGVVVEYQDLDEVSSVGEIWKIVEERQH